MFRSIMVALDGSERAEQVLPLAAQLARTTGGVVILVQVVNLAIQCVTFGFEPLYISQQAVDNDIAQARRYLHEQSHHSLLAGLEVQTLVEIGDPAQAIIDRASEKHADLVVLSSRGYTGMKRWLLGSVAEKIARHALVPVFILREHMPLHLSHTKDG